MGYTSYSDFAVSELSGAEQDVFVCVSTSMGNVTAFITGNGMHSLIENRRLARSPVFGRHKLPNGTINALKFSLCDFYTSPYPLRKKRIK
jgi:hypothetical protein